MKILLTALNAKYIHSSLALRSLTEYCHGLAGGLLNIETAEFTINNEKSFILSEIYSKSPDVIGFSCYIWNINMILDIASNLKKVMPKTIIFLGGPEVSFDSDKLLKDYPFIDFIIRGEGEKAFYNTARRLASGSTDLTDIKGLTFRNEGEIIISPPENELPPDEIPFAYKSLNDMENRIIYYESQRGCPYNCQFCLSSIDGHVRFLSERRTKSDLDFFLSNNVRQVKFVDRTFNCNKEHAHFIWQYLMQNDNGQTNFHMEIEAHILDDSEIEFLRRARKGLFQFEIGVQSTNTGTLACVSRSSDFDTLKSKVLKIKEGKNIHVHLDLIAGLPHEDYESFKKSFNDVYSLRPEQLQLGFLKLLKGSGLRRDAEKYGIVYDGKAPYEVLYTKEIDFTHMLRLKAIEEMVETYYNSFKLINTERYVSQLFDTPFDMYEQLADYWRKNLYHTVNHSKQELYNIFYDFCSENKNTAGQIRTVKDLLKFDMLLSDNIKTFPDFAQENISDELKNKKRRFFNTPENIHKYLPKLLSYTPAQISRMCRIEYFDYDVFSFAKHEATALNRRPCYVLYNYFDRDIITNHSSYSKIDI